MNKPVLWMVVSTFPPYAGGTGNVALHNALEATKNGYEVHVVTLSELGPNAMGWNGLRVHRIPSLIGVGNAGRFQGLAKLPKPNLIHLHLPFILGADQVFKYAENHGVPVVATYHQDLVGTGFRKVLFLAYQHQIRRQLKKANAVVVPTLDYAKSSKFAKTLLSHDKLVEIPNGVDLKLFSPDGPEDILEVDWNTDKRTLLFVGGLDRAHHFKGLHVLLEAVHLLGPSGPRLLVVGSGELRPRYERLAERLGIRERVHFLGKLALAELPKAYRAADCCVLPSVGAGEIFGLVLIEAMACGTPVVASNLPGVRAVVGEIGVGILASPGPEQLAEAIRKCLLLAEKSTTANATRQWAMRFGWSEIGKRLAEVYRRELLQ